MSNFKVGDRVIYAPHKEWGVGVVRCVDEIRKMIYLLFPIKVNKPMCHYSVSCFTEAEFPYSYSTAAFGYLEPAPEKKEPMKTPEESYGIYSDGHHIVKVWRNDKEGIAKCNPEDTFNFKKGLDLAFSRLEAAESGIVAKPEGGSFYYHVTTSQGSVSHSSFVTWWLEDKLNAALKNAFVSEEAAKAHADEVIKKYEKVIAYAETL